MKQNLEHSFRLIEIASFKHELELLDDWFEKDDINIVNKKLSKLIDDEEKYQLDIKISSMFLRAAAESIDNLVKLSFPWIKVLPVRDVSWIKL